jgi:hypothetical protein
VIQTQAIGDFLWGGAISEAVASSVFHRVLKGDVLLADEHEMYTRFADEEVDHERLLKDAARQYTTSAWPGSVDAVHRLNIKALLDIEALAVVLAAERISRQSFTTVRGFFLHLNDSVTVHAYNIIAVQEPAHIVATRRVLARVSDSALRVRIGRAAAMTVELYRAATVNRSWARRAS